jgi:preprotein translocase subunit SecG
MANILQVVQLISGLLLILLILLHSPKGDGLGSIGGAAQLFSSQKGAEAGINKLTAIIAIIFIAASLVLGLKLV